MKGGHSPVGRKVKRVEIDLSDVEGARLAIEFLQKLIDRRHEGVPPGRVAVTCPCCGAVRYFYASSRRDAKSDNCPEVASDSGPGFAARDTARSEA